MGQGLTCRACMSHRGQASFSGCFLIQSLYGAIEPGAERSKKILTVSFYFVLNKR